MDKRVIGYCCPQHGNYQRAREGKPYECHTCEGQGVPVYEWAKEYVCRACGNGQWAFEAPMCCGAESVRAKTGRAAPMVIGAQAFEPFVSPATGQVIRTQAQYKDDLKASNCVEYEPGIKQDQERRVKREERETSELVDKIVTEVAQRADGLI